MHKIIYIIALTGLLFLWGCGSKMVYISGEEGINPSDDGYTESVYGIDMVDSTDDIKDNQNVTDWEDGYGSTAYGTPTDSSLVAVYVCGAVVSPGVYYLPEGAINQQALDAAGGFAEGAAVEYVNLAAAVSGGDKLYFPYQEELEAYSPLEDNSGGYTSSTGTAESDSGGRVNLNTATRQELMTLSGIGGSKADAIISYRNEQGLFTDIEDIKKVSGIGDSTYNNIKDSITVN
jgi:competence protein ComEA